MPMAIKPHPLTLYLIAYTYGKLSRYLFAFMVQVWIYISAPFCLFIMMQGVINVKITKIEIRKAFDQSMTKATVSITINDEFTINNIKIMEGEMGRLFVAMPSQEYDTGPYSDIMRSIDYETRKNLETQVLLEYYNQAARLKLNLKQPS